MKIGERETPRRKCAKANQSISHTHFPLLSNDVSEHGPFILRLQFGICTRDKQTEPDHVDL